MMWPFDKLRILICGGAKSAAADEEIKQTVAKHAAAATRFNRALERAARAQRRKLFGEELLGNHNATDT